MATFLVSVAVLVATATPCLYAIRIAMRQPAPLQSYLDRLVSGGDATWQAEFEQPFEEYARRQHGAPR